jgi:hypothetical protein
MIERLLGYLKLRTLPVSDATRSLEDRGFACLRGVLADAEIEALRTEVDRVFEELPPDVRIERRPEEDMAMFRYEMLNQTFDALGLEKAPDKTFIGRVERGFDFLGYHLAPDRLTLARATVERFLEQAYRLYEQERGKPEGFPQLGAYTKRWMRWSRAGLTNRLPVEVVA